MQRHYDSFELFTGKQRSLTSADSRGRSMSGVVYADFEARRHAPTYPIVPL